MQHATLVRKVGDGLQIVDLVEKLLSLLVVLVGLFVPSGAVGDATEAPIEKGTQEIQATVTVTYAID